MSHNVYPPVTLSLGFTWLELLCVLAILCMVSWVMVPTWRYLLMTNRAEQWVHHMTQAMAVSRSEAVRFGEIVQFCGSQDQARCDGHWREGQIILVRSSQHVVRRYPALSQGYRLVWRSSFGHNDFLAFTADGFTAGQQGTFYYCPPDVRYARGLVVVQSGRVRVLRDEQKIIATCSTLFE